MSDWCWKWLVGESMYDDDEGEEMRKPGSPPAGTVRTGTGSPGRSC